MIYNIHPLFVHFPIALLIVYSAIAILPLRKWIPSFAWRQIQQVVLLLGVLGAMLANSTGEIAEELVRPDNALVEMHSLFAGASTWIYGILLVGEVLFYLNTFLQKRGLLSPLVPFLMWVEKLITHRGVNVLLAVLGLVAISVTGLLGGVMVYGVSADPVAPFVMKLLGLSI
jgi:uncharacterized membrane protein